MGLVKNEIQSPHGIKETILFLCAGAVTEMINLSVCTLLWFLFNECKKVTARTAVQ